MTPEQITLVKSSWDLAKPRESELGVMFYTRLFDIAPETKALFGDDVHSQAMRLMQAISVVINSLDNLDRIFPQIEQLAERHVDYGVKPEHYAIVGEALIWTLHKGFGEDFTDELKEAWLLAYTTLSGAMQKSAYENATA
jgi:nitric oxide dioxygenase